jgi:hypothetical protein
MNLYATSVLVDSVFPSLLAAERLRPIFRKCRNFCHPLAPSLPIVIARPSLCPLHWLICPPSFPSGSPKSLQYQSMPQHPSQTPLLSAPSPTGFPTSGQYSRFSGMSGLSSSPSQLSSYTAGAGSTVPFNDYPSSDHQSDTEKRYSMVPSLMGLNHRASSVFPSTPPAAMYMWDEKDPEMDDALHRPDPEGTKESSFVGWSWRGVVNLTAIAVLLACLLMLFLGYPILTEMRNQNARGPAGTFKCVFSLLEQFILLL